MEEEKTKTSPKATKPERKYSQEEFDALLKMCEERIEKATKEASEAAVANYIKTHPAPEPVKDLRDEMVTLMFAGTMATGCYVSLGDLGQINSNFGTIDIPKKDFLQKRNYIVDKMLADKTIIVLNGLTDAEMERYGYIYKEGEIITAPVFYKMLDFSDDEIVKIFNQLCRTHKQLVATVFITAYQEHDNRVSQSKVKALNNASKATDPDGMFTPILKDMGKNLSE